VLRDHADSRPNRVLGRADLDAFAADADLALVGMREPVQDAHQRRLAGAVLAQQSMNRAGREREVDTVVGDDVAEVLHDPAHSDGGPVAGAARPNRCSCLATSSQ
jgi:hypothetical protein